MMIAPHFIASRALLLGRRSVRLLGAILLAVGLAACQSTAEEAKTTNAPPVVEVTALDYAFVAPDTIPSGWVTFRLNNKAEEIHEIELGRLPEEATYADLVETIPVWDTITARVEAGELVGPREVHAAADPKLPDWSPQFITSLGLVSPGRTAEKTEYLEPGTYAMLCFVKSPDGQTHLSKGMHRKLVVRDDSTGATEPDADMEVTVGGDAVNQDGTLSPGTNTIAARFEEESKGPEAINLIRVEEDTDLEAVEQWVNWYTKGGLMAPAPAEFLGGDNIHSEAPKGSVAYFTVEDLEPGRYAWVVWTSEGPFSETFTVK